jgi:hypothetical protein
MMMDDEEYRLNDRKMVLLGMVSLALILAAGAWLRFTYAG